MRGVMIELAWYIDKGCIPIRLTTLCGRFVILNLKRFTIHDSALTRFANLLLPAFNKMIRDEIVSQTDLLEAIEEALHRKGVYSKIKSQLRAEVFHTLEDKSVAFPDKPKDVYIASELIREFLMGFKLNNSLSVFSEEFGQPAEMNVDREFVGGELGLNVLESNPKVPLLVLLVQHLMNSKSEVLNHLRDSTVVEADSVVDE